MAIVATAFNPFIVSTDVQKTDAKTRKLIRSHVMLGKNRGKRRTDKPNRLDGGSGAVHDVSISPTSGDESRPTVPVKVGNDYSLIRLAEAVEPTLIRNFLQFANSSKAALFPLEPCIAFSKHQEQWVSPITYDVLFLNATIFASQAALGFGSSRDSNGSIASRHFGKTVNLLRRRLEQGDPVKTTADTTLMVMIILAMSALLSGQEEVARSHMAGVKRIFEIRGGFSSFGESVKLLIEMLRCDIGLTLSTGKPPLFFHRPFSGPHTNVLPTFPTSGVSAKSEDFEILLPTLDKSLSKVWICLRDFCKTINTASKTHRRLSEQAFLDNMASNVYPLLNLRFACGTVSETCRLALLAFCSNAFLQWQGMNLNYKALPSMYRQSLLKLTKSESDVPPRAMLWLLMMGGIALFAVEEDRLWLLPWLRDIVEECGVSEWESVRDILQRFLWVDFIHDRPGEKLYAAAMAQDVP